MSKHRWGFFPFDATNYKAAQAYLDKKTEAGWVLDKLYLRRWARFVPNQGQIHCVDLDLRGAFEDGPEPEYLQLCEDSGWELIKRVPGLLLFRSKPGEQPAPIQSDPGMEGERFWKRHVRKQILTGSAIFLFLALLLGATYYAMPSSDSRTFSALLLTNFAPLFLLALVLAVPLVLWGSGALLTGYCRWRASGTLTSRYRSAWTRGVLTVVFYTLWVAWALVSIAESFGFGETVDVLSNFIVGEDTATWEVCESYPILLSRDLGLEEGSWSRSLEGHRSPLVDSLIYDELYDHPAKSTYYITERYDCSWEWVARALVSLRRSETARGSEMFFSGELPWESAPSLGFDESWMARGGSYLLFRQGKTVALVGAPGFDLTEPDNLAIVRQRLLPGE